MNINKAIGKALETDSIVHTSGYYLEYRKGVLCKSDGRPVLRDLTGVFDKEISKSGWVIRREKVVMSCGYPVTVITEIKR